jgi:hypothetical protein
MTITGLCVRFHVVRWYTRNSTRSSVVGLHGVKGVDEGL